MFWIEFSTFRFPSCSIKMQWRMKNSKLSSNLEHKVCRGILFYFSSSDTKLMLVNIKDKCIISIIAVEIFFWKFEFLAKLRTHGMSRWCRRSSRSKFRAALALRMTWRPWATGRGCITRILSTSRSLTLSKGQLIWSCVLPLPLPSCFANSGASWDSVFYMVSSIWYSHWDAIFFAHDDASWKFGLLIWCHLFCTAIDSSCFARSFLISGASWDVCWYLVRKELPRHSRHTCKTALN